MTKARWLLFLVSTLSLVLPQSARAAGLITALAASANPVAVNTDVTFTVKGTGGGCGDLTIDYGDGQSIQLTSVSFSNNTNTTTPAHKYALAKTYIVKATPGKSCTGTATLSLVVTSASGGGGGGGGWLNKSDTVTEVNTDPSRLLSRLPRIDTVFPFSVIRPGGGVIVQGASFGTQPGQFKLKLQNGQDTSLGNLTWEGKAVSGIIDANISGVLDQPARLRVVTTSGFESNEVPVQFTARREVRLLPMADLHADCSSGSDRNRCDEPGYTIPSLEGWHGCTGFYLSCNDAGNDEYWTDLANGWEYSSSTIEAYIGRADQPVLLKDEPGSFRFKVYWDTEGKSFATYLGWVYVEGPAGTPWK